MSETGPYALIRSTRALADKAFDDFVRDVDAHIRSTGGNDPAEALAPDRTPITGPSSLDLVAAGIGNVIWCTGYRPDFDWVKIPVFDARGVPVQERGVTACPGLYFLGLHWMYEFRSGILFGVGDDAAFLAGQIRSRSASSVI